MKKLNKKSNNEKFNAYRMSCFCYDCVCSTNSYMSSRDGSFDSAAIQGNYPW